MDYRRPFAFIILNECQLRAIDLEEEICFRFGIKIQSTFATRFFQKPMEIGRSLRATPADTSAMCRAG